MKQKKISIIVPVYNVREYLDECMSSLVNQTYPYIEIIIVDDGSTDGSDDIYNRYAAMDDRIKVIRQKNMGVVKARKNAIAYATGEYVGFVDSDDYIELDYYEKMINVAAGFDLVTAGCYIDCEKSYGAISKGVYKTEEEMLYIFSNMIYYENTLDRGLTGYMCDKLFKTDIAKCVFEEVNHNIFLYEDSEFLFRYVLKSKSVMITDICGYYYRMRNDSVTHSVNERYLENLNGFYLSLKEVFNKYSCKERLVAQLQRFVSFMLSFASAGMMGFAEREQYVQYIFPYMNELKDKKVVLYGAGMVGKKYYRQIKELNQCEDFIWVDKDWQKFIGNIYDIKSPDEIVNYDFDYVIVAVKYKTIADDIRQQLLNMGIDSEKILWKEPIAMMM